MERKSIWTYPPGRKRVKNMVYLIPERRQVHKV